jgi:hypothetical protein
MLDIVKLSIDLSQEEFNDFLHYLKTINEKGVMSEWLVHWEAMVLEGTDYMSAMHYAYYDILIDPQTGSWKQELAPRITSSFDNLSY